MDRRTFANVITGIILILAGLYIIGQMLGFWNFDLLTHGWWTLFLILPAIAGMIVSGPRFFNISLLLLGVWLFLEAQGWLGAKSWYILLGILLILLGIRAFVGKGPKQK